MGTIRQLFVALLTIGAVACNDCPTPDEYKGYQLAACGESCCTYEKLTMPHDVMPRFWGQDCQETMTPCCVEQMTRCLSDSCEEIRWDLVDECAREVPNPNFRYDAGPTGGDPRPGD